MMINPSYDDSTSYYKSIVDAYDKGELWIPSENIFYNCKMVLKELSSNNFNLEN